MHRGEQPGHDAPPPALAEPTGGSSPLSFGQERLWFLQELDPESRAYNLLYPLRLGGRLDPELLAKSIDVVVGRHESLRTVFPKGRDGRPTQVVLPSLGVPLRCRDVSDLPAESVRDELERQAWEEIEEAFSLASGPLLRARLVRLAPDEHVLLLVVHHIVADGWSLGLLAGELAVVYDALASGRQPELPELPLQYPDYARWQREQVEASAEGNLDYWRSALAGLEPIELRGDRPRPPAQTHVGAYVPFRLDSALTRRLLELAVSAGVTPFMLLLGGFQVLLARYARQTDVAVGVPIAGRPRRDLEPLIGFFVNTLALRTDLSGDPTFRQVLGRVCDRALEAYGHQLLPFERIVAELAPERDLTRNPFFEVTFSFQSFPDPAASVASLEVLPLQLGSTSARFDLELYVTRDGDELAAKFLYKPDLFDAETVETLARRFQGLLADVAANPDLRLSELSLLSEDERARLCGSLARGESIALAEPGAGPRLEELVAEHARSAPDRPAVVHGEESITYAELDRRADRLARRLLALGGGPETPVAVYLERSPAQIVGLLAALKAGRPYLPVDVDYPGERVAFTLADSGAIAVVTDGRLRERLPATDAHVVLVDEDGGDPGGSPQQEPARLDTQLAYVIYTSGSTGRPKGVALAHRGVLNLLADFDARRTIPPGAPCSSWTSIGFDVSVYEIFSALVAGGTLHLVPDSVRLDPPAFIRWLVDRRIEAGYVPVFALPELRRKVREGTRFAFRRLLVGVESIAEELLLEVAEAHPELTIVVGYGPTETTVCSTNHTVPAGGSGRPNVPIGRPVANFSVYLLDEAMGLVPPGVPGELCAGGPGLAWGYFRRPGLTAERFVPDPFSEVPGARLYRTGDLARHLPDGTIEFLGRADTQVKVRGFRVELGEIEATLREHPGIADAAVLLRDDVGVEQALVAYVVPDGEAPELGELRSFLSERLPTYMLPRAFVVLAGLPLNPHGKVDRRALRPPHEELGPSAVYVAPRTETERALADLWARALGVESVGLYDDFFERGGHSLVAAEVVAAIQDGFGIELPLRELFTRVTVAALAEELDRLLALPPEDAEAPRPQTLSPASLVRS